MFLVLENAHPLSYFLSASEGSRTWSHGKVPVTLKPPFITVYKPHRVAKQFGLDQVIPYPIAESLTDVRYALSTYFKLAPSSTDIFMPSRKGRIHFCTRGTWRVGSLSQERIDEVADYLNRKDRYMAGKEAVPGLEEEGG